MPSSSFTFVWRAVVFVALFFLLQVGWQELRGTSVERAVIHAGTVVPTAFLINILTPAAHAQAVGFQINAVGGGLLIFNGCEGIEALCLLLAAFAVAPLSWSAQWWGVLWGTVVVFAVNQVRLLALFYVFRHDVGLFKLLHEVVTPIAVILVVSGYFYAWLIKAGTRTPATA